MDKRVQVGFTKAEYSFFQRFAEAKGFKGISAMMKVALFQYAARHPAKGLDHNVLRAEPVQDVSAVLRTSVGGK